MILSRRAVVGGLLTCAQPAFLSHAFAADDVIALTVSSDGDELAFTPDHLTCPAHARVRLVFHHTGTIISDPHDWVLLKPGTEAVFIADADKEAHDVVIPGHDAGMVLAATPLCGKGGTVMVEFTAPAAGTYRFVCSIAGHGETMQGTLIVT